MDINILQKFIKEFGKKADKKFYALREYKKVYMLDRSQHNIDSKVKWDFQGE